MLVKQVPSQHRTLNVCFGVGREWGLLSHLSDLQNFRDQYFIRWALLAYFKKSPSVYQGFRWDNVYRVKILAGSCDLYDHSSF